MRKIYQCLDCFKAFRFDNKLWFQHSCKPVLSTCQRKCACGKDAVKVRAISPMGKRVYRICHGCFSWLMLNGYGRDLVKSEYQDKRKCQCCGKKRDGYLVELEAEDALRGSAPLIRHDVPKPGGEPIGTKAQLVATGHSLSLFKDDTKEVLKTWRVCNEVQGRILAYVKANNIEVVNAASFIFLKDMVTA